MRTAPILALLTTTLSTWLSSGVSAADPAPQVRVDGAAIVRGAGRAHPTGTSSWHDTSTGDVLTAGVTVQASADQPLEMMLPDGVTISLDPGALVQWGSAIKLPSEINRYTRGYHLQLIEGELEVRMPLGPKGEHAFLVETRAGTLTDWRGVLHVTVHGDTEAAAIYQGALVVGSNGQGFPVYDGAGILMRRGVNPDKSRGIPRPPTWQGDASTTAVGDAGSASSASSASSARSEGGHGALALVAGDSTAALDLAWARVPDAVSYRIEIATDPTMVRVEARASVAETRYTATNLSPGVQHYARVRAVSAGGIVGEWSAALPLRVVRYDLPEGAFVAADDALVLPGDASVHLEGTEGMEVAYENVSRGGSSAALPLYWYPLHGPLRLPDEAAERVVHLRDPSLNASGRLVLARRELRAVVDLTPRNASWPADAIDARVVLRDPSGRVSTASTPVTLEALLDLTPLAVDWQRHGDTWTGRIAPRSILGPSVVRVRVLDATGTEIGRGFVEIGSR
jgi:hypothetical protein